VIFLIDRHDLLALLRGIVDEIAVTTTKAVATESIVTEAFLTEVVLTEVFLTKAVLAGMMERVAVAGAVETVMGYMSGVGGRVVARGLRVCAPTEG